MCNWIEIKGFNKNAIAGKPCIILTADCNIQRYVLGTWELGHGWKSDRGLTIYEPVAFKLIEAPEK